MRAAVCPLGVVLPLAAGTIAFWNVEAKSVTCLDCLERRHVKSDAAHDSLESEAELLDRGKAGSSASQRYARLHARREQQVRDRFGRLSGIYLALTDDPQSTVAWAQGSRGEQLLGGYLEKLHDERTVIRSPRSPHSGDTGEHRSRRDHAQWRRLGDRCEELHGEGAAARQGRLVLLGCPPLCGSARLYEASGR